jgi:hypothetical protein
MRPQPLQHDDQLLLPFNPHDSKDQEKVQEFAKTYYPKLFKSDTGGSRNTIKYYDCCHVFISRRKVNHNHDEDTCMNFAVFIHRHHVKDEKSFESALIKLMKRDYDEGKQVFCPSYNTVHRAVVEEEDPVEIYKKQISEKDTLIASLQEQLCQKNNEIDSLKKEKSKSKEHPHMSMIYQVMMEHLREEKDAEIINLNKSLSHYAMYNYMLDNIVYDCQRCSAKLDPRYLEDIKKEKAYRAKMMSESMSPVKKSK